jgi:hypothetical protein
MNVIAICMNSSSTNELAQLLLPAVRLHGCRLRFSDNAFTRCASEVLRNFLVTVAVDLDAVPDLQHGEEPLDIAITQPDASMRRRSPNRTRRIRPVYAVSLQVQSDPARAHGIVFAAGNHRARPVVSRIRNTIDDAELARRAGTFSSADRNCKAREDALVFHNNELSIRNTDQDGTYASAVVDRFGRLSKGRNRKKNYYSKYRNQLDQLV